MGSLKRHWPFEEHQDSFSRYAVGTERVSSEWNASQTWSSGYLSTTDTYWDVQNDNVPEFPYAYQKPPSFQEISGISHSEPFICFGTILDVRTQLRSVDMPRSDGSVPFPSFYSFQVEREGNYYILSSSGRKFALLNQKICEQLEVLLVGRQLRCQAYVQSKDWKLAVASWQTNKLSTILPVEINIYGSQGDAKEVGRILSKFGTFLQQPQYGVDGFLYCNPHYLQITGFSDSGSFEDSRSHVEDALERVTQSAKEEEETSASAEVNSILNSLSHHGFLREEAVDARIKSSLLAHQKEAIDFIIRRETSNLPPSLSLWRYYDDDPEQPFYRHILSGAKRPQPDEAKGGILADDMGLGKSLVILSAIAGSLDRAAQFALTENQSTSIPLQTMTASKATLIVAPSSLLLDSWIDEIRKHTYPGYLDFHKHHGQGRETEKHRLFQCDIVFTTYATIATELYRGRSILGNVRWFRVVLDEAHDVRNPSTKQFQAIAGLVAEHRWCLTGTPIQNSLEDLGALVTFLKVPILEMAPSFRKYITNHSKSTSKDYFSNLRTLLGTICLRRTRELLHLPEPAPQTRKLRFSAYERTEYDNILFEGRKAIDMAVSGHRQAKVNSTVLESLLKLRLFCNNGISNRIIQTGPTGLPSDADEALSYLQQNDEAVCAYCSTTIYSINDAIDTEGGIAMKSCFHLVCRGCISHCRKVHCPLCASGNSMAPLSLSQNSAQLEPRPQYPSKLLAFLDDIQEEMTHKSIVFSSWKKTLDLIGQLLTSRGMPYYLINGSLSLTKRVEVLKNFRSPNGANILLMTLGTGAVGLNLAVASRICLLEPQWNPSIESQAIGRALRIGQTHQVRIVRYIMENTVEDSNVLSRQEIKLQLAGGGFSKGKSGISSERMQSLLDLFGVETSV